MNDSSFCQDSLWDLELTWYTDNPDFTTCFHQTVLTYIPAGVLLLLTPLSLWSTSKSRDRLVPWTVVNVTKVALNLLLMILPFIDLGYAIDQR